MSGLAEWESGRAGEGCGRSAAGRATWCLWSFNERRPIPAACLSSATHSRVSRGTEQAELDLTKVGVFATIVSPWFFRVGLELHGQLPLAPGLQMADRGTSQPP